MTEQQLREKLRKIYALFEGATTPGERGAAEAAMRRLQKALREAPEPAVEMQFTFPDQWQRRLFTALCRRHGLNPNRYPRQRHTTVMVKAPSSFINRTLWPEYLELSKTLFEYLNDATERIIREEVFADAAEAAERAG